MTIPTLTVGEGTAVLWDVEPEAETLYFTLGGRVLKALPLSAFTLSTPFTKLSTDLDDTAPPWDRFPEGFEAAVVPAKPVDRDPPRVTFLPQMIRYVSSCYSRYFVDIQGSFAGYLGNLGLKGRNNLKRRVRRFTEFSGGQIEWSTFRSPLEMRDFRRLAIDVSTRSWKDREADRGFPRGEEFQEFITHLAAEGRVRGYILFHRGRPIAHAMCRGFEDLLYYARSAYDEGYARWSPGTVLFYLFLEELFSEGRYRWLDFGEAPMIHKREFSTGLVRCARIIYFRRNRRNLAVVAAHVSLETFSRGIGRGLRAIRLKDRIKKWLKGQQHRPGQLD
jgi:hypothetical protein